MKFASKLISYGRRYCHNSSTEKKFYNLIRNIGLVAHIDAGKTTTTERMLFYSGSSDHIGEVHHGNTVMDYMEQERERGITIKMAAATIRWLGHSINLIDTPGHVDFTFEVERSLSVLDGGVVILDGAAGVQAQTIKIWQQVRRNHIPSLFYVNKMDKPQASIERCLETIQKRLHTQPILLQFPIFHDSIFTGLIDVVSGDYLEWPLDYRQRSDNGQSFRQQNLLKDAEISFLDKNSFQRYQEILLQERERLISHLCDHDDLFADYVLGMDKNVSGLARADRLRQSLRQQCLQRTLCPTLLGSSYRNIGVQPLLDSVCHYLPGPLDNEQTNSKRLFDHYISRRPDKPTESLCALAFKIHYHHRLGLLTFLRLYSGSLLSGMGVYNLNRQKIEKIAKVYRPFADHFVELKTSNISMIGLGDIVAVSGLSETFTGDTLVHPIQGDSMDTPLLAGIDVPEPVYFCSLECSSLSKMKQLELALDHLQREDPSFRVQTDETTQQMIIKGMGQLHIEVIKDRIKREYGVQTETGPLQVSYKETIICPSKKITMEQTKTIGGHLNQAKIVLQLRPIEQNLVQEIFFENSDSDSSSESDLTSDSDSDGHEKSNQQPKKQIKQKPFVIRIVNTKENNLVTQLKPWQLKAIYQGIEKSLEYGPLLSFPVVGVEVSVYEFESVPKTSPAFITNTTTKCMLQALKDSNPILMEPIMRVEIITPEQFIGAIISDLTNRRCQLIDQRSSLNNEHSQTRCILAYVPLSEIFNYSTVLRTISSGMATMDLHLHSYRQMDPELTAKTIQQVSGVL